MRHIVAGLIGLLSTALLILVMEYVLHGNEYLAKDMTDGTAWLFAFMALIGLASVSAISSDSEK